MNYHEEKVHLENFRKKSELIEDKRRFISIVIEESELIEDKKKRFIWIVISRILSKKGNLV